MCHVLVLYNILYTYPHGLRVTVVDLPQLPSPPAHDLFKENPAEDDIWKKYGPTDEL